MARIPVQIDRKVWRTIGRYISALRSDGLRIQAAYLYGSHVKGTAREWSDIDVAIVARNLSGDWHDDLVRLNLLANRIDPRIEAVGYLPTDFRDESPLVWEIKTTGIPVPVSERLNSSRRGARSANQRSSRRAARARAHTAQG